MKLTKERWMHETNFSLEFWILLRAYRDVENCSEEQHVISAHYLSCGWWWDFRTFKADSQIACCAHAVPLPWYAAKGLECIFPFWFTQCGHIWFILAMPCPCHAPTMPFFSRPQHSTAISLRLCCAVALRRTTWSEHGMGMAWQVWIRYGRTV